MARTRRAVQTSTGTRIQSTRHASHQARDNIATYYRRAPPRAEGYNPLSPPLRRAECLCRQDVTRWHTREACWNCQRWHHSRLVVPFGTGADHIDSCIYVWLWPRVQNPPPGQDPDPYRPCRLCRELTCHEPGKMPRRMCPWCQRQFRPTGAQAQERWDRIFAAETFQAYAGRVLMAEGNGDWNLRKRMAEFDPARFIRCDRDLLGVPLGPLPQRGHRLDRVEWGKWWNGTRRRFPWIRDVIIYEKKGRGRQGDLNQFRPPLYGVSRINMLAHTLEGDPDWDNFRDMCDDRSRTIE